MECTEQWAEIDEGLGAVCLGLSTDYDKTLWIHLEYPMKSWRYVYDMAMIRSPALKNASLCCELAIPSVFSLPMPLAGQALYINWYTSIKEEEVLVYPYQNNEK